MKRLLPIALILLLVIILWVVNLDSSNTLDISPEELQGRVLLSKPVWTNYNEDIKGQIGSTPVARWNGGPIRASINQDKVTVVFSVEGYWASTAVNLPILAKEPLGDVLMPQSSQRDGQEVSYLFPLKPEVSKGSVWLEIQYPHSIKRIVFDSSGKWEN